MKDLTQAVCEIAGIFEALSVRYAVLGVLDRLDQTRRDQCLLKPAHYEHLLSIRNNPD